MARASACPSVVLPTPGTPSISRCPRAKMLTSARRTTSSFPRITRRRAFSSSAALWDTAVAVSRDIWLDFTIWRGARGVTDVTGPQLLTSSFVIPSEPRDLGFRATTNPERERESILRLFELEASSGLLLHKLRRASGQPLDAIGNWRMG